MHSAVLCYSSPNRLRHWDFRTWRKEGGGFAPLPGTWELWVQSAMHTPALLHLLDLRSRAEKRKRGSRSLSFSMITGQWREAGAAGLAKLCWESVSGWRLMWGSPHQWWSDHELWGQCSASSQLRISPERGKCCFFIFSIVHVSNAPFWVRHESRVIWPLVT